MLIINLNEKSTKPKYKQIIEQIIMKISNNSLSVGDKLPSTRNLAEMLGIHRSTVSLAYQELWSLGYIDLNSGSCAVVRERKKIISKNITKKGIIEWENVASNESNHTLYSYLKLKAPENSDLIDFSTMNIDDSILPVESFRSCLNEIIRKNGSELFKYDSPLGYYPLRKYIAMHLETHGISVMPEEIMITNGTQQAIDLVFQMIASPYKKIVIEAPTYKEVLPLLNQYKLKPVEIPMGQQGMELDILEEKIISEKPALIYTMPNFQNPTGITTSQTHRERLLNISEKFNIPILEDGFEEEMKYFGKVVLPIKSMDRNNTVIYCSTFSKVLFPGLRIGWIAADMECIARLASIRHFSEISLSMILQAGLYNFCSKGCYDKHISKLHRTYRKRMNTALNCLKKYINNSYAIWQEPAGGYLIWLKLAETTMQHLENIFESYGIRVSMGSNYFYSRTNSIYLRLSISALNESEIEEGIKRLGKALIKIYN